jgi:hypothetical protein
VNANRIRVPVPAETGGEDRLVGSLTFRHAAYLAAGAAGVAVMVLGDPSAVRIVAGALLALVGLVGALCRLYGEPLDRLVPAGVAFAVRRHREGRGVRPEEPSLGSEEQVVAEVPELGERREPREPLEVREVRAPAEVPQPAEGAVPQRRGRHPVAMRRVAVVLAVLAVVGIGAVRLATRPAPAPPPERQVVVVPIPVPVPDPWEEVDDALDTWIDSVVIG